MDKGASGAGGGPSKPSAIKLGGENLNLLDSKMEDPGKKSVIQKYTGIFVGTHFLFFSSPFIGFLGAAFFLF